MRRTYRFVTAREVVECEIDGARIVLPVFPGVLKHTAESELRVLLASPAVARRYTREALRRLPWPCLRQFPPDWLRSCLAASGHPLPVARQRAIEFLLAG